MTLQTSSTKQDDLFLPNLCGIRAVFFVVLIAELFAFFLALAPLEQSLNQRLNQLGLISLFVQWCALISCALLCLARPILARYSNIQVGIISYLMIVLVIFIVTECTYYFVYSAKYAEYFSPWHRQFLFRNLAIGLIITGPVLRYFYIQNQWRRNVTAETESRLQALQSRIRPHFLFNSMNTIASLTRSNPEQAELAVENLSDLFRVSLRDARQHVRLEEEIELCQRYLEIEKLRLGERLEIEWDITIPDDALVPPLLLQPLLENAIYHGIESQTEGGCIRISGQLNNQQIEIKLLNPRSDAQSTRQGHQIAQQNVRERLTALYGNRGQFSVTEENHHYLVSIQLPYETEVSTL